jgi:hypothetical protein
MLVDLFGPPSGTQKLDLREAPAPTPAPLPDMDLCVMNPPFTRSVGGNLLFGSSPPAERKQMQKKLSAMLRDPKVLASSTAGLGSVFLAVAHSHIKPGGRLAVVLPKAVLSGVAWSVTRQLLRSYYRLEYIISSHDPERWNFSESTDLSEVLVVAVKRGRNDEANDASHRVTAVNLWRNPVSPFDALAVSRALALGVPPDVEQGQGALEFGVGDHELGQALSLPGQFFRTQPLWLLPCAFAQPDLVRAAFHLLQGTIWLPGFGASGKVPLTELQTLATIGPDRRDIHDGFRLSATPTAYAALWGHDAAARTTLETGPNAFLAPLGRPKRGRPLRRVEDLWPNSGPLLVAERLRLNTQRVACVRSTQRCLSNVWWPTDPRPARNRVSREKALCLWFNGTLGLLSLLCHRVETQGPWVCFKKPVLAAMPVLDVAGLPAAALKHLARTYDALAHKELQPFPQMDSDPVRTEIDAAMSRFLGLPDISVLRRLLGAEPTISLKRL